MNSKLRLIVALAIACVMQLSGIGKVKAQAQDNGCWMSIAFWVIIRIIIVLSLLLLIHNCVKLIRICKQSKIWRLIRLVKSSIWLYHQKDMMLWLMLAHTICICNLPISLKGKYIIRQRMATMLLWVENHFDEM